MNFIEYLLALSMGSFLGLVFSQLLFWQQGLKQQIAEKAHQAYAFILIHQHLQLIEDNLSAICSILPFSRSRAGLSFIGQELVQQKDASLHYPVLQGDVEWFDSEPFAPKTLNLPVKYFLTNLHDYQILLFNEFSELPKIKLSPPFLSFAYREQHLDFKDHKIRIYQQGRPQTLVSGVSNFSVKILSSRQLEWHVQFQQGATFTWVVDICKNVSKAML